jgi:4-hydroxy-tetrahydrodipicolinate synthase
VKKLFSGVCTAMVTPFCKSGIDFPAFKKIIDFNIAGGVSAICFLGTTGEACTVTYKEKLEIINFAMDYVDGRVPVIFGIGGNNPTEILRLGTTIKEIARDKRRMGGAKNLRVGVLLTAPYYNKCTQAAAVKHFAEMSNAIKLPMIVYNIPTRVGMNLEVATLKKICEHRYIYGVKESCGNIAQITEVVLNCPSVAVYSGDDTLALPSYAVGCAGVVSVASNVHPRETVEIWAQRRRKSAIKLFQKELPLYRALFCEINPGPIKYIMAKNNFCDPNPRPPLTPLQDDNIIKYGICKFFKPICN